MFNNIFSAKKFSLWSTAVAAAVFLSACGGGGGGGAGGAGGTGPGGSVVSDAQMAFTINKSGTIQALAGSSLNVIGAASVRSVGTQKNTVSSIIWRANATSSGNTIVPSFSDGQCLNIAKSLNEASCSTAIVLPDNIAPGNFVITGTATGSEGSVRSETFTIQVVDTLVGGNIETLFISSLPVFSGLNQTIAIPAAFTFKSGVSVAPANISLIWVQTSGPSVLFAGQGTSTISFSPQVAGTYGFNVKLSAIINGVTETRNASVIIIAEATQFFNLSAGPIQSIPVNQTINLNGTVSNLAQTGLQVTYLWTQVSGPATVTITNTNSPMASFLPTVDGDYVFKLTASTRNYTQNATTQVTVLPPDQNAFSISAGVSQVVNAPNSVVSLNGVFLANPGAVASNPSFQWTQLSGPPILLNSSALLATFIPQGAGVYVFQLSATARGVTKTGTTQVTVLGPVDPNDFSVYAGDSKVVNAPNSVVSLNGAFLANPGAVSSNPGFQWTQLSGPPILLNNSNALLATFIPQGAGIYVFQFSATARGVTKTATTQVTVLGPVDPNFFSVYAGDSQTKPINTVVMLAGTVTANVALSGSTQTYQWTQPSGPVQVTLSNANSKTPSFITSTFGNYTFTFATTINGVTQTSQTTVRIQ